MKFRNFTLTVLAVLLFVVCASAQNGATSEGSAPVTSSTDASAALPVPDDFESDGCTKFPDGNYIDCCREHDLAYYYGGTWSQRWKADKKLYRCVAAKPKAYNKVVAPMMWLGVRALGGAWLGTKASWGFGMKGKREAEKKAAAEKKRK